MTSRQAAEYLGCSVSQVQTLCKKGLLVARRVSIPTGYRYDVDAHSVKAYRRRPQKKGWPRGKQRAILTINKGAKCEEE